MAPIFRSNSLVFWDVNVSSANLLKGENGSFFRYFPKTGQSLNKHFLEVSNDASSNTGWSRVESESVTETLKAVKSGM